ncbi:hypothetical protein AB0G02_39675 [Actinosynnema sp. NPDC023658]|uniref:hypothetical protein n=1 Tax=Actinosynnema sp. NPDC023658 TaxID=3155465 RepID=UPI0033E79BD4
MLRRTVLRLPLVAAVAMGALAATAPAQAQPSALHAPGDVHFATTATRGDVAHTIRRNDGSWYPFATVPYAPIAHFSGVLASVIVGDEEHLMQQYYYGVGAYYRGLRYVIRHADGSWTEAASPPDATGSTTFALTAVGGELHRVRRADGGPIEHTARHADGTWSSPTVVAAQSPGDSSLAVAADGGVLRVFVVDRANGTALSSFVRRTDGTWGQASAVPFAPAAGVTATSVDVAQVGAELHAAVIGSDGAVYHAALGSTGWTQFRDISSQTGAPGDFVNDVAVTASRGTLHLAVVTRENRLLHTIRLADGRWLPFGDVKQATGSNVLAGAISIAGS